MFCIFKLSIVKECFLDCMSVVLEQQQNIEYYRFILSASEVLTISQFKDMYYDL